ncbi:hypothetical protein GTU79_13285 [Sodalis ligni]|uniref:hypothetical protein n=1 Tax=Sodalis ligni TaxID=2697027 RepID=UPI001BDF6963|nr:hypothetical protein [Sodalis ligni]QWA13478.1 hypothetical protein GTU79_13285 [Sodalis ligni]
MIKNAALFLSSATAGTALKLSVCIEAVKLLKCLFMSCLYYFLCRQIVRCPYLSPGTPASLLTDLKQISRRHKAVIPGNPLEEALSDDLPDPVKRPAAFTSKSH